MGYHIIEKKHTKSNPVGMCFPLCFPICMRGVKAYHYGIKNKGINSPYFVKGTNKNIYKIKESN